MKIYLENDVLMELSDQEVLEVGAWYAVNQKHDKARTLFEALHRSDPKNIAAATNLATVLASTGDISRGMDIALKVLEIDPNSWGAHINLGKMLGDQWKFDQAKFHLQRACESSPNLAQSWFNLAANCQYRLQFDEAIYYMRRAIKADPQHAMAHAGIGMLLMLQGRYDQESLSEFEWKGKSSGIPWIDGIPRLQFDATTETLLLIWEQGIGDSIQFVRYAKAIKAALPQIKRVVVYCQPGLDGLMSTCPDIDEVITDPSQFKANGSVFQVPLISSMNVMRTLGHLPICVEPAIFNVQPVPAWGRREQKLQIGVVWRGNKAHGNDRFRSIPFHTFRNIAAGIDADFYALEYGMSKDEYAAWNIPLVDLSEWLTTAQHIKAMDLVITCDTAIAHLAGSLRVPTWILLSAYNDWRFGLYSSTTPWYPTAKLIRQTTLGDWAGVVNRVNEELIPLVEEQACDK